MSGTAREDGQLALALLGTFEAEAGDQPLSFATDATRALFAYLVVESGRSHRREFLATLLWPDQPQSAAFANLRQTLARLRRGLPKPVAASVMSITRQTLEVHPDKLDLDCARFEYLIATCADHIHRDIARCRECAQRLEQACALYRGEFLDGVFAGSSQLFDEWALSRREHYRQHALSALHTLSNYYESIENYEAARRNAARQLEFDPWREEAHRQMMRALAFLGQRTAALDQYENLPGDPRERIGHRTRHRNTRPL